MKKCLIITKSARQQTGWRNRIVGEGEEAPDQLLANPRNWRIHPHEQEQALCGVLDEVGWVQRVVVNKRTGFVVDGHLRIAAAITRGEKTVPVLYVDLSEDEEAKVLATFDPISGMAAMDADKFKELVSEIEFASADAEKAIASAADDAGVSVGDKQDQRDGAELKSAFEVVVECDSEAQQRETFEQLKTEGKKCRLLTF